jgi:hypothetical protein
VDPISTSRASENIANQGAFKSLFFGYNFLYFNKNY